MNSFSSMKVRDSSIIVEIWLEKNERHGILEFSSVDRVYSQHVHLSADEIIQLADMLRDHVERSRAPDPADIEVRDLTDATIAGDPPGELPATNAFLAERQVS